MRDILGRCFRPTAVAFVVRRENGLCQFGSHVSAKAFAEDSNTRQRCTVQGGIEDGESPMEAMTREIREEYGQAFVNACDITRVKMLPIAKKGRNGNFQFCYWFWVVVHPGVEPEPNKQEVHQFFWDDCRNLSDVMDCMSEKRAKIVGELTGFSLAV